MLRLKISRVSKRGPDIEYVWVRLESWNLQQHLLLLATFAICYHFVLHNYKLISHQSYSNLVTLITTVTWKHWPYYWSFVCCIFLRKDQKRGAVMISFFIVSTNCGIHSEASNSRWFKIQWRSYNVKVMDLIQYSEHPRGLMCITFLIPVNWFCLDAVRCRYNAVQFLILLNTALR